MKKVLSLVMCLIGIICITGCGTEKVLCTKSSDYENDTFSAEFSGGKVSKAKMVAELKVGEDTK